MDTLDVISTPQLKWYEIWWHIWTNPGPNAFRKILMDPGTDSNRGFIWIAVVAFIAAVVSSIVAENPLFICSVILTPAFAVLGLAIFAGIMHGVAKVFKGSGTWRDLAYCFATVSAPLTLLSIPGAVLSSVYINSTSTPGGLAPLCFVQLISIALGIYAIVLNISAIEAVEKIGTGKAVATYFIPFLVVFILALCAIVAGLLPGITEAIQSY